MPDPTSHDPVPSPTSSLQPVVVIVATDGTEGQAVALASATEPSKATRRTGRKLLDHGIDRLSCRIGDLDAVLVGNEFAHALAVEALPSQQSARAAVQSIKALRAGIYLDEFGTLAVAFQGVDQPSRETIDVLREAEVYLASEGPQESAEKKAWEFLADVDRRMAAVR